MSSTAAAPVSSPLLPISCLSTSSTQSSSSSSLSSPLLGQRSRTVLNKDNQLKLSCLPGPSASPSLSMNSYRSSQSSSSSCQSRSGTCDMITNISTTRGGSSGGGHKKCKEKVVEKEKMILMKCQRLKPDKTYEEIEIELPVDIFNRMVNQNNKSKDSSSHNNNANLSLSRKLRNIFIR